MGQPGTSGDRTDSTQAPSPQVCAFLSCVHATGSDDGSTGLDAVVHVDMGPKAPPPVDGRVVDEPVVVGSPRPSGPIQVRWHAGCFSNGGGRAVMSSLPTGSVLDPFDSVLHPRRRRKGSPVKGRDICMERQELDLLLSNVVQMRSRHGDAPRGSLRRGFP